MAIKTEATDAVVDLSFFLTTEESEFEVNSPDGKPTGWKVRLASPALPQVVEWNDRQMRQNLHKQKLIEQAQVNGKKYIAEEKTPDEQRRENVDWVIARILDWTPVKLPWGTFNFSRKAAEDLLTRPEMYWALLQFMEAIGEEKRFMKRSATT
jgi:hypothetical protein